MVDGLGVRMQEGLSRGVFPGAVWRVSTAPDRRVHEGAIGNAVVSPTTIPTRPDTLYDLASVTKVVVSVALMRMLERGQVTLDDRLSRWFSQYAQEEKSTVSLWHLLTHTSGIPGDGGPIVDARGREATIERVARLPLAYHPGAQVAYSSKGYILLGAIMEDVEQRSLDQIIDREINHIIGSRFLFNPAEYLQRGIAATEVHPRRGRLVWGEVHDETCFRMGGVAAHAGLFGTVEDVSRLGLAMLDDASPLLHRRTKQVMMENQTPNLNLARGLGWQTKDRHGSPAGDLMSPSTIGHTGFTGTSLFCDPETGLVATLLTNRVHPTRENTQLLRFRRVFHNTAIQCLGD